jgi:hypothetical protein
VQRAVPFAIRHRRQDGGLALSPRVEAPRHLFTVRTQCEEKLGVKSSTNQAISKP